MRCSHHVSKLSRSLLSIRATFFIGAPFDYLKDPASIDIEETGDVAVTRPKALLPLCARPTGCLQQAIFSALRFIHACSRKCFDFSAFQTTLDGSFHDRVGGAASNGQKVTGLGGAAGSLQHLNCGGPEQKSEVSAGLNPGNLGLVLAAALAVHLGHGWHG
jgi:hypothetical protein